MKNLICKVRRRFDSFIGVEEGKKSTPGLFYLFLFAAGLTIFIFAVAILWHGSAQHMGPFGDFIGGTLNPLLTFLTFMGLLVTIVLQQTELRDTRTELERSATALEKQIQATDRQNFESTFFQMLTLHNTIVNSIDLFYSGWERETEGRRSKGARETKGRDCFSQFFDNFKEQYDTLSDRPDRERLQMSYDAFWQRRQQDLAHYYRYLYNVLRFVHEAQGIEDRGPYVKLLRAQLSDYELVMLFYTALNKHGINYWLYIHEYQLFDNLPSGMLIDPAHKAYYSARSFGAPKRQPPDEWPPAKLADQYDAKRASMAELPEVKL